MSGRRFGAAGYFGRPERSLVGWVLVSFPVVVTCVAIRLVWSDAPRLMLTPSGGGEVLRTARSQARGVR
jgi:hypothetical protein